MKISSRGRRITFDNIRDIDPLMNPAIGLAYQIPRVIQKVVPKLPQEEIVANNLLRLAELLLGLLKIELDIELFQEPRDRVLVLILFHLDDLDNFADGVADTGGDGCLWR